LFQTVYFSVILVPVFGFIFAFIIHLFLSYSLFCVRET
jgi:phosphate/sulfate permease